MVRVNRGLKVVNKGLSCKIILQLDMPSHIIKFGLNGHTCVKS